MRIQLRSSLLHHISLCFILSCLFIDGSEQCAATAPGTTPQPGGSGTTVAATTVASVTTTVAGATTTTVAGQTTTTAAATTTTATPACKMCDTLPLAMSALHSPFASDTIDNSGTCTVRKFVCMAGDPSLQADIAGNTPENTFVRGLGTTTLDVTCNNDKQWEAVTNPGNIVTIVNTIECQAIQ